MRDDLLVRVNALIRTAREAGRTVVIARTEHQRDRSTWTLNMLDDDEGFAFPGTEQARLLDGLDSGGHVEVVKTRDSAFHGTTLRRELDRLGVGASSCAGCPRTAAWRRRPSTPSMTTVRAAVAVDAVSSDDAELSRVLLEFLREQKRQPLLGLDESLDLLRTGHWPA